MGLWDRTREEIRHRVREFVLGPGAVDPWKEYFGVDPADWSPKEYGSYIATSNGVYVCVTLRAELLSSLSLRLYKEPASGDRAEVTSGQLYDLLRNVNPFWTLDRLLNMTEQSLGIWGQAFWFLERGDSNNQPPREIWWGRPDRVRVVPHETEYIAGFLYEPVQGQKPLVFSPDEVIWFPLPNILDEWAGLAPLGAARLAADVASAAMKSNKALFDQGMQMGGVVWPKGTTWTDQQADDMRKALEKRFRGVENAHKWGVFRREVAIDTVGISPRDAEFLGALSWSLEDICRAYRVPLDLIGGQRTYQNREAAERAIWSEGIRPRARFIQTELTEKLLPMFLNQADVIEFDFSGVEALQEAEQDRWARANEQLKRGAITINEWRDSEGKDDVPWGDVAWLPLSLVPVDSSEPPEISPALPAPSEAESEAEEEIEAEIDVTEEERTRQQPAPEFGSQQHELLWRRFVRRADRYEERVGAEVAALFVRLQDSVQSRLHERLSKAEHDRSPEELVLEPFDKAKWTKAFRETMRVIFRFVFLQTGESALDDLGLGIAFDVESPNAIRFLERQTQRFVEPVLDTTWRQLKDELAEGINEGEGIPELSDRVEKVMAGRIRSSKETIARTETIRVMNAGTMESWVQSGIVEYKRWLAALDERTRDSHVAAHGQEVPLEADFVVGAGQGPAPGQIGIAEEDINCRCTMQAVLKTSIL